MSRTADLPNAEPRLLEVDGKSLGIRPYDIDNGYPQRMQNLYNASSSAKMAANLCARYILGNGFENLDFYNVVIGKHKGLDVTPDSLLRVLAPDKAKFKGFGIHINYNALYEVDTVKYVPFEQIREGEGEETAGKWGVYKSWWSSKKGGKGIRKDSVTWIDGYNPDPGVIEQQVQAVGGWVNYNGQLFYYSDEAGYPLATIDQVLDDVEAEIASAKTRKNNLKNNFQLKQIYIIKGQVQDDEQDEIEAKKVKDFMGPDGSPVMVVFSEREDGMDVPDVKPVTANVDDKAFAYTDQTVRAAIYQAFGQPAILHSDYQGTNGYNEGQLPQSMEYYINFTEPDRIVFETTFREIFKRFKTPVNTEDNYRIAPLQVLGKDAIEEEDTRPLIEILGVGGLQGLQAVLADPNTTPEQKKDQLVIVFGLDEVKAAKLAGYVEPLSA